MKVALGMLTLIATAVIVDLYYFHNLKALLPKSFELQRNLDEYKAIHEQMVNGQLPAKVCISSMLPNGYANQMYAVLTAFVIAVLSDRALFISGWPIIAKFIEEPFNRTFYDFGHSPTPFNLNYETRQIAHFYPMAGFQRFKVVDKLTSVTLFNDSVQRVGSFSVDAIWFSVCSNPLYYEKLWRLGLVERATIDTARTHLSDSNRFRPDVRLESVLRVGYEVAGRLLNKHWLPKARLRELIDHYVQSEFQGRFVIGMQMRSSYMNMQEDNGVRSFLLCAENVEKELLKRDPTLQIKWFVSTDQQSLYDRIYDDYSSKIIRVNGTIGHVGETTLELYEKVYEKTLLDNELLARCDELIITGGSTFGFVAAMKTLRMPLQINYNFAKRPQMCTRTSLATHPPEYMGTVSFK